MTFREAGADCRARKHPVRKPTVIRIPISENSGLLTGVLISAQGYKRRLIVSHCDVKAVTGENLNNRTQIGKPLGLADDAESAFSG